MVLAAFAQDSIDREFPPKQPTAKGETMDKLTPCAECGNDQALLCDCGGPLTGQLFWVECLKCGHKTPKDRSAVTVITFWDQEAPRGSSGTLNELLQAFVSMDAEVDSCPSFGRGDAMHDAARAVAPEWLRRRDDDKQWLMCFTQGSMAGAAGLTKDELLASMEPYIKAKQ